MDVWPTDTRPRTLQRRHGKNKAKEKEAVSHYPAFEVGTLTAGTLAADSGRLEWTTVPKFDTGHKRLFPSGQVVKAFPVTRSRPLYIPHLSVKRRAEQGANFLRTYHPDVDIPAELIRDVVSSETQFAERLAKFDPGFGEQIAALYCTERRKKLAFLAFPIGELGSDLDISEMQFSEEEFPRLMPSLQPVQQFDTPIRQIATFSYSSSGFDPNPVLAIRTFASIIIFTVRPTSGTSSAQSSQVELSELTRYENSLLGCKEVVDMKLYNDPRQVFLVTDQGTVFKGAIGASILDRAWSPNDISPHPSDGFWRISKSNQHGCFLSSSKAIMELDFRKMDPSRTIFEVSSTKDFITSFEFFKDHSLLQVTTTSEIVWIDPQKHGKPLLACKHSRDFDRTLRTHTVTDEDGLIVLSSLKNDLMTLYNVNRGTSDSLLHLNMPPYSMSPFHSDESYLGLCFVQGYPEGKPMGITLMRMSNRRGIFQRCLSYSAEGQPDGGVTTPARLKWNAAVKEFESKHENQQEAIGPLGGRDANEIDLRLAYERFFMNLDPKKNIRPAEDADLFYETLEKMPSYLQDPNATTDQMLTAFDVAFRSGEEPQMASRADFLTQSALSSTRGYRALMQDRIPISSLRKQAPWSYDLSPFLARFMPELAGAPEDIHRHLLAYNLAVDDYRSGPSIRRENEAHEQLTLDLALSSSIFSPQPFSQPRVPSAADISTDLLETMSRATQAMSLEAGDLPPFRFGYLSPVVKKDHYGRRAEESSQASDRHIDTPLGVRLLLQEWDVGSDPDTYEFHDPYGGADQDSAPTQPRRAGPPPSVPSSTQPIIDTWSQSQRPPTIASSQVPVIVATTQRTAPDPTLPMASQPIAPISTLRTAVAQSQGTHLEPATQSSQEMMPSTQILAGPFGGRQGFVKKKPQKKRLGGF